MAAVKDMASNLERKWRQMLPQTKDDPSKNLKGDGEINEGGSCPPVFLPASPLTPDADPKPKKRKLSEPPAKAGPPAKKAAVAVASSSTKATTVKKETKSSAVKDAKSDSSFFSAPKPKPKLPSFRKAPVPVKKEPDVNVAQPSSVDPFQEALKSMGKAWKETPTPLPGASVGSPSASAAAIPAIAGKKKKSVTWAPESRLEQVKYIEKAIYDDDPVDVSTFLCLSLCYVLYVNYAFVRVLLGRFILAQHSRSGTRRGCGVACAFVRGAYRLVGTY
jgi:protein phosphatase 1 regulatory subunit 10